MTQETLIEKNAQRALSDLGELISHDERGRKAIDDLMRLRNAYSEARRTLSAIRGKIEILERTHQ